MARASDDVPLVRLMATADRIAFLVEQEQRRRTPCPDRCPLVKQATDSGTIPARVICDMLDQMAHTFLQSGELVRFARAAGYDPRDLTEALLARKFAFREYLLTCKTG